MNWLRFFILTLVSCLCFTPTQSGAATVNSPECRKYLEEFYNLPGIAAMAVTSDGRWCGRGWGFSTAEAASARALRECRSRKKGACSVIKVSEPANKPTSKECMLEFRKWKKSLGFKAFAVNGNGRGCGWQSLGMNKRHVVDSALRHCKTKGKGCHVIAFVDGVVAGEKTVAERAGRIWIESNLVTSNPRAIIELQQKLLGHDCGVVEVDGKLGQQTYMATGRCIASLDEAAANKVVDSRTPAPVASTATPAQQLSRTDIGKSQIARAELSSQRKIALVIGNNSYSHVVKLDNPINDASQIAAVLKTLGFETTLLTNGTRLQMEQNLIAFSRQARQATTALIFYAGHGMQHHGVNYLLPVDVSLNDPSDIRRLIKVQDVVKDLQNSKGAKILVLDACRDNEAVRKLAEQSQKTRSASVPRGLASERADGVIIAYATQPGQVAVDGANSKHSPFTSALLKHIETPKLDIRVMLTRVRADVRAATGGQQTPETSDSMIGEFAFNTDP